MEIFSKKRIDDDGREFGLIKIFIEENTTRIFQLDIDNEIEWKKTYYFIEFPSIDTCFDDKKEFKESLTNIKNIINKIIETVDEYGS